MTCFTVQKVRALLAKQALLVKHALLVQKYLLYWYIPKMMKLLRMDAIHISTTQGCILHDNLREYFYFCTSKASKVRTAAQQLCSSARQLA